MSQRPLSQWTTATRAYSVKLQNLLPRLSHTGTIFRESVSTIEERQRQFESLITSLFHHDIPEDFRTSWAVHHFFSYWWMDYHREQQSISRIAANEPHYSQQAIASTTIAPGFRFRPVAALPAFSRDRKTQQNSSNGIPEDFSAETILPNTRHSELIRFILWMGFARWLTVSEVPPAWHQMAPYHTMTSPHPFAMHMSGFGSCGLTQPIRPLSILESQSSQSSLPRFEVDYVLPNPSTG